VGITLNNSLNKSSRLDWSWLEAFQFVAEHQSLSAASRASGLSQPTLSRHIAALEKTLGTTLFDRSSKGLVLAPAAYGLLEHASTMLEAVNRFSLHARGQTQAIEGTVRITASDVVSAYLLPELIAKLRQEEPSIQVEVFSSDRTGNLLQREADIAIRMYQPTQQDVITKKLGSLRIGLFASCAYIETNGQPTDIADFARHELVGYDSNDQMILGYRAAGINLTHSDFQVRCDNQLVSWELCKAGCGIGVMQEKIGNRCSTVKPLFDGQTVASLPVWLAAHAELRTSARIARVFDFISQNFEVDT
jgi:DNA-binding transcriptional LysR family regulator